MFGFLKNISYSMFIKFIGNSPELSASELNITSGTTLEIMPGVKIKVSNDYNKPLKNVTVCKNGHIEFDYSNKHYALDVDHNIEIVINMNNVDFHDFTNA